ncbi:phospholipase ABHD3-like [Petromyzon marinus]|uniref:phospholipase ABHD3-like n=1 Tax=Petromyzon marinus TaxID=7757 RepID=UPI003F6E5B04
MSAPLIIVMGLLAAYTGYYLASVAKKPVLEASIGFRAFLEAHCPVISEPFLPTAWCCSGRIQSVLRFLLKSRPPIHYRTEVLATPDGGQLSLEWLVDEDGDSEGDGDGGGGGSERRRRQRWQPAGGEVARPTVLLLPGLTSNSRENYVLHLVQQTADLGYRCAVFNYRGCGEEELLTPRMYSAANTEDLELVVLHIRALYPDSALLAVGMSMGGMMLLNYLAAMGRRAGVEAALTVSVPWDAFTSTASLETPLNSVLFNRVLTHLLTSAVHRHREVLKKRYDVEHIMKSRSLWEYDERLISIMFGYSSVRSYYHDASPCHKLPAVRVPVLCLNAADDPLSPASAFPLESVRANPYVALLVTARGGHLAFLEGLVPRATSYMDRLYQQFARAVLGVARGSLEKQLHLPLL